MQCILVLQFCWFLQKIQQLSRGNLKEWYCKLIGHCNKNSLNLTLPSSSIVAVKPCGMTFNYFRMFYQKISVYCFLAIIIPHGRFPFFSPFRDKESNWFLLSLKYLLRTVTSPNKNGICAFTKHHVLSFFIFIRIYYLEILNNLYIYIYKYLFQPP